MTKKILLLGSGELGKEFVIAAKRKGQYVVACDSYAGAPAMQVADEFEVFSMLDGDALDAVVAKHKPDIIVPEIEAIRTERLYHLEKEGIQVVPSAKAVNYTMNRKAIRDLAAKELGLKTAKYFYAKSLEELKEAAEEIGFPCVVKPLMSSSGKGQSLVKSAEEVAAVRPGCFWLCESVERGFHVAARAQGFASLSDAELYQAFDAGYDYDVYPYFRDYLEGKISLTQYADRLDAQEWLYPDNYVKLRFLENHDRARAAHILPDEKMRRNWTAFLFFQRGLTLVYNGQEADCTHVPSLFDKDPINWNTGRDQSAFLAHLAKLKRDPIFAEGSYTLTALPHDVLLAVYEKDGRRMAGLFSLRGESALVRFPAPNGVYRNCIDGSPVEIYEEQLAIGGEPIVLSL